MLEAHGSQATIATSLATTVKSVSQFYFTVLWRGEGRLQLTSSNAVSPLPSTDPAHAPCTNTTPLCGSVNSAAWRRQCDRHQIDCHTNRPGYDMKLYHTPTPDGVTRDTNTHQHRMALPGIQMHDPTAYYSRWRLRPRRPDGTTQTEDFGM